MPTITEHHALDLEAIEALFRQAMSWAKVQGIAIRPGRFGEVSANGVLTLCPSTAVLLRANASPRTSLRRLLTTYRLMGSFDVVLAQMIGRTMHWVVSFRVGFDTGPKSTVSEGWDQEAAALGQRLRAEIDAGMWD